jgi:Ca2+:H+ antiporter
VARRLLWASLVLAPVAIAARYVFDAGDVTLFVLAAVALIPLAWLIGESTEHAAEHTGAGVGGFLNASFGNAPELIITIFAVNEGLLDVVRGSIAGSVISNILLVFGIALVVAPDHSNVDRRSLLLQLALVLAAVAAFLVPSIPGFHGDPNRDALAYLSIPVAVVLLGLYLVITIANLRRHSEAHQTEASAQAWTLRRSIAMLAVATLATALVSEILVHSLEGFGEAAGLSDFFISIVIVAIVGNAAEHGGAIVIARRGKMPLASEIAISSSAQVALFVAPAITLVSFLVTPKLSLAFRPIELIGMAGAALIVAFIVRDGTTRKWEGWLLLGTYGAFVVWVLAAGDRAS